MNVFNPSDVAALLSPDVCIRLTQSLVHFLWQGFSIGLAVWVVDRLSARASSRFRYAASVAAMLAMLACVPATYISLGYLTREAAELTGGPVSPQAAETAASAAIEGTVKVAAVDATIEGAGPTDVGQVVAASGAAHGPSNSGSWQALHSITARLAPYATLVYLLGVVFMLARLAVALWSGHRLRS